MGWWQGSSRGAGLLRLRAAMWARPSLDGLKRAPIWVKRAGVRWEEGGAGRGMWRAATGPRRRRRRVHVAARPLGQRQVAAAG